MAFSRRNLKMFWLLMSRISTSWISLRVYYCAYYMSLSLPRLPRLPVSSPGYFPKAIPSSSGLPSTLGFWDKEFVLLKYCCYSSSWVSCSSCFRYCCLSSVISLFIFWCRIECRYWLNFLFSLCSGCVEAMLSSPDYWRAGFLFSYSSMVRNFVNVISLQGKPVKPILSTKNLTGFSSANRLFGLNPGWCLISIIFF